MVSFLYSLPSVRDESRKALIDIEQPKNNEEKEEEVMSESEEEIIFEDEKSDENEWEEEEIIDSEIGNETEQQPKQSEDKVHKLEEEANLDEKGKSEEHGWEEEITEHDEEEVVVEEEVFVEESIHDEVVTMKSQQSPAGSITVQAKGGGVGVAVASGGDDIAGLPERLKKSDPPGRKGFLPKPDIPKPRSQEHSVEDSITTVEWKTPATWILMAMGTFVGACMVGLIVGLILGLHKRSWVF